MILIFLVIVGSFCQEFILKPHPKNIEPINMQIGEFMQLNYPLNKVTSAQDVYSRSVVNANLNDSTMARICKENPPTVTFSYEASYIMNMNKKHPLIVTDFTDLLYRRGVIDAILHNNYLYTLFQNGSLLILKFDNENPLTLPRIVNISNLSNISQGQLLIMDANILVIADAIAYLLNTETLSVEKLQGSNLSSKFSMATKLTKQLIAVAQLDEGVAFYTVFNNNLISKGVYGKEFFTQKESIYIVDLAFDGKETLYVLDQKGGLSMINVSQVLKETGDALLIPDGIMKANCDSLLYTNQQIIMICGDIFRYKIQNNRIDELPKLMFKVKEMAATENLVIMMGDNLFNLYWYDRYVQLFQFTGAQRIILDKNKYIAIKDSAIYSGKYKINSPTLQCQADDLVKQQSMDVLFKTGAKCSTQYLNYLGDTRIPQQWDTCLYTIPAQIIFWKANNLQIKPIIIGVMIIGVLVVVVLLWICVLAIKHKRLNGLLQRYQVLNSSKGYNTMVEEGMKSSNISIDIKQIISPAGQSASSAAELKNINRIQDGNDPIEDNMPQIGD